jgi:hypothetical protein
MLPLWPLVPYELWLLIRKIRHNDQVRAHLKTLHYARQLDLPSTQKYFVIECSKWIREITVNPYQCWWCIRLKEKYSIILGEGENRIGYYKKEGSTWVLQTPYHAIPFDPYEDEDDSDNQSFGWDNGEFWTSGDHYLVYEDNLY